MTTYYVYHIQKRQEWGCTTNLNRRLKQLGYSVNDVVEVLSFTNIDEAADTERELNIRDGYGWNTGRDYRNIIKNQKPGGGGGFNNIPIEQRKKTASINGKNCHLSGNLDIARKKSSEVKSIPIDVYDYKTNKFIGSYKNILAVRKELKLNNIYSVLNGSHAHCKGYTFKLKNN